MTEGGIHCCISRSSLGTFILCAGTHSLVELTEHDDSAADIILVCRAIQICAAAFIVHNVYR